MRLSFAVAASLLLGSWLGACGPSSTQFLGASQFPNGPTGCQARCTADGLEMSGFVYSGEFATSCVCRPRQNAQPGQSAQPSSPAQPAQPSQSSPTSSVGGERDGSIVPAIPGVPSVPASAGEGSLSHVHAHDEGESAARVAARSKSTASSEISSSPAIHASAAVAPAPGVTHVPGDTAAIHAADIAARVRRMMLAR